MLDRLIDDGHQVIGVDNFDPFYDRALKIANIAANADHPDFELLEADLADSDTYQKLNFLLGRESVDAIIHIAAKAGVRPSIEDPVGYQRANIIATQNLLEFGKDKNIKQFIFASSSSVYGVNPNVPWRENDYSLQPISPYASTKLSCELMGHVYNHLYGIRFLCLRLFSVYGPRQRPDLAINKFVRLIEAGEPIPLYGDGSTRRDYTFVADIVEGIISSLHYTRSNFELINLGNDKTITLAEMVTTIETVMKKKACIDLYPAQPGDVPQTWADISKAREILDYKPKTTFKQGVELLVNWRNQNESCNQH